jgi:hypothetical protein
MFELFAAAIPFRATLRRLKCRLTAESDSLFACSHGHADQSSYAAADAEPNVTSHDTAADDGHADDGHADDGHADDGHADEGNADWYEQSCTTRSTAQYRTVPRSALPPTMTTPTGTQTQT